MPIYEYKCPKHGIHEYLVRNQTEEVTICGIRQGDYIRGNVSWCKESLKKLMSSGSFRIQGVYPAMERRSDIKLRERNQALKNKVS